MFPLMWERSLVPNKKSKRTKKNRHSHTGQDPLHRVFNPPGLFVTAKNNLLMSLFPQITQPLLLPTHSDTWIFPFDLKSTQANVPVSWSIWVMCVCACVCPHPSPGTIFFLLLPTASLNIVQFRQGARPPVMNLVQRS